MNRLLLLLALGIAPAAFAQQKNPDPASQVNVFLGTSGDHGQMSPAASYPFSMISIGPQTYPSTHTGYEYLAKKYLGFTHTRFEGVGCRGSGGNILVKPFLGKDPFDGELIKTSQQAGPGYFEVAFENKINAAFAVYKNTGVEAFTMPAGQKGFYFDLSYTLANGFVAEEHTISGNSISGWVDARTTCSAGKYRLYYYMTFDKAVTWADAAAHRLIARVSDVAQTVHLRVGLSSVSIDHAQQAAGKDSYAAVRAKGTAGWNEVLGRIAVKGDTERAKLFYSLLYRTVQSPYLVSEQDGQYRATDGSLQKTTDSIYHGWAIWDNYRTQLPLLSVAWPERYKSIAYSIANLYKYGKKDFATDHEPSNTVRTEHAVVVLLDALRKGYPLDLEPVIDKIIEEVDGLDYSHPDKALESSYDAWALSEILRSMHKDELAAKYAQKALEYKKYWEKDFKDITRNDVDRMQARGLYQGTIWQYRWFVPFDVKGLMELTGGENTFIQQLDEFFNKDYYNHANEPDLQVPFMYNATKEPWKSQALVHQIAVDTVVQDYFNDNSRGIGSFIDVIYRNAPNTYIRTMDDDAGAMSAWFVFAACGFSPACVGWPVYYLNVPLFKEVDFNWPGQKKLQIKVENFTKDNRYIAKVVLNGKELHRNYLTQQEIMSGGTLVITASATPVKTWPGGEVWISSFGK